MVGHAQVVAHIKIAVIVAPAPIHRGVVQRIEGDLRIGQGVSEPNTRQKKREKREHELYFVAQASDAINNALNKIEST